MNTLPLAESTLPFHLFTDLSLGDSEDKKEAEQSIRVGKFGTITSLTLPQNIKVYEQHEIIAHFKKALTKEYGTHIAALVFREHHASALTIAFITKVKKAADRADQEETSDAAAMAKCARMNAALAREEAYHARKKADEIANLPPPSRDQASRLAIDFLQEFHKMKQLAEEAEEQAELAVKAAATADKTYAKLAASKLDTDREQQSKEVKSSASFVFDFLQATHAAAKSVWKQYTACLHHYALFLSHAAFSKYQILKTFKNEPPQLTENSVVPYHNNSNNSSTTSIPKKLEKEYKQILKATIEAIDTAALAWDPYIANLQENLKHLTADNPARDALQEKIKDAQTHYITCLKFKARLSFEYAMGQLPTRRPATLEQEKELISLFEETLSNLQHALTLIDPKHESFTLLSQEEQEMRCHLMALKKLCNIKS